MPACVVRHAQSHVADAARHLSKRRCQIPRSLRQILVATKDGHIGPILAGDYSSLPDASAKRLRSAVPTIPRPYRFAWIRCARDPGSPCNDGRSEWHSLVAGNARRFPRVHLALDSRSLATNRAYHSACNDWEIHAATEYRQRRPPQSHPDKVLQLATRNRIISLHRQADSSRARNPKEN